MPTIGEATFLRWEYTQNELIHPPGAVFDESLFIDGVDKYTNFTFCHHEIVAFNGSTSLPVNSPAKFFLQGKGDLLIDCWINVRCPALAINTSADVTTVTAPTLATAAYLCNYAAFAMWDYIQMKVGLAEVWEQNWLTLWFTYEIACPAGEKLNSLICKFANRSQLIQRSKTDFHIWMKLPIWWTERTQQAFPGIAASQQQISLEAKCRSLAVWHNNEGKQTVLPYKYGTTTAVAASDYQIRVYLKTAILEAQERRFFVVNPHAINYSMYLYSEQSVAANLSGSRVTFTNLPKNHPCMAIYWLLRMDSAVAGTARVKGNIGEIDHYNFFSSSYGESMYGFMWQANSSEVFENESIPTQLHRLVKFRHAVGKVFEAGNAYGHFFQTEVNKSKYIHGVNMTKYEKHRLSFFPNHDDASTMYEITKVLLTGVCVDKHFGVPYYSKN